MVFNSYKFILIFLPIVFIGYYLLAKYKASYARNWMGFVSIFFYSYWSLYSLPTLIISILVNFYFGKKIYNSKSHTKKKILYLAIVFNLILLCYFKYANFFISNINILFLKNNLAQINNLDIFLPIGISFFTFTQIAYLIDTFNDGSKSYKFRDYFLFVTYFPHLVAGPIIHHKQVMPQFLSQNKYFINYKKILVGFIIFIIGLSKKVLIADSIGIFVNNFYDKLNNNYTPDFFYSWIGSISYSFQIYFDFSGYSDMAVGLSLLFGIFIPFNFNSPFKALNIIEFWQRWHISLTNFIGQYFFNPLTLKLVRKYSDKSVIIENLYTLFFPLFITFILIGIWHGANWTFFLYGAMHGLFMIINHLWRKINITKEIKNNSFYKSICWLITFLSVVFSMAIFRADNISSGLSIYSGMFGLNGINEQMPNIKLIFLLTLCFIITFKFKSTFLLFKDFQLNNNIIDSKMLKKIKILSIYSGILLFLCLLQLDTPTTFLYYQF